MSAKTSAARLLILLFCFSALFAYADDWLHVYVHEKGDGGEKVKINLPFSLVEAVIPLIDEGDFSRGKVCIHDNDYSKEELIAIFDALRDAENGEYIHVEEMDENVSVAKKGEYMLVHVEEDGGAEQVDIKIHMSFFEALLSGEEDELDVLAALRSLRKQKGDTLVMVNDDDSRVRIWIDDKCAMD